MPIKEGDMVKVHYTGTLEDGTVFDSSEKSGQPLEFKMGQGQLIPGFEKGVLGLEKDEEKEIKIPAAEAYGEPNPQLVRPIPKDQFPKDKPLEEGMVLALSLPTGQQIPAKVIKIDDVNITLDMNHPLAGKTLIFKIKVVDYSSE